MRRKQTKGIHTRPNSWDDAAALQIMRGGERIDPGVNFFVLMLDQMALPTYYSCEGHPDGFYVVFEAPYEVAQKIHNAGFFSVEIEKHVEGFWSIRRHTSFKDAPGERVDAFRWAAQSWEDHFGALDFNAVTPIV